MRRCFLGVLILTWAFVNLSPAQVEPTIISPPPASGASPSAPIVFTFSEAMDTEATTADFIDITTFASLPTTEVWSVGNTVLTCTPAPAFPANRMIIWSVNGQNPAGESLGGEAGGFFTTGSGSGGSGGSGTNAITMFSVGKAHVYNQTSTGLPALDVDFSYAFNANTTLSSNRTATNVVLTLPTSAVSNLMQNLVRPEMFFLSDYDTNLATFDVTFPAGDYSFQVKAVSSNQTVAVNLPTAAAMPQPGAPHVNNYAAAQVVDPNQPFVLGWDAFAGGTANDYIAVEIDNAYGSANPGLPGALTGTATSFTIPAGTLQPNSTYDSDIAFYRFVAATNGTSYSTLAYRATLTRFTLITTSGAVAGPLVLTNASWSSGVFSFDVRCTPGQTVTIETNVLASAAGPWPKLLTTNSPGALFHIISPQAGAAPSLFYRARNGP